MAERKNEILLIAPKLLGESLALQIKARNKDLKVSLNKEELTKHPSVVIWSLDALEITTAIQIEVKKLEEYWQPSPILLLLPNDLKPTNRQLLQFNCAGLLQDPDLQSLIEAITIIKDGGRVVKFNKDQHDPSSKDEQTLGLSQWLLISGLQQISKELSFVEEILSIDSNNFFTLLILQGRKRELLSARLILIKLWGSKNKNLINIQNINETNDLKPLDNIKDLDTNLTLKTRDSEAIWELISAHMKATIENNIIFSYDKLPALEGLNNHRQKELFLALHKQLDNIIKRLQKENIDSNLIIEAWNSLQVEVRKESLRALSGSYNRFNYKGESTPLADHLISISEFLSEDDELPDPTNILNSIIYNKPLEIDGELIPPDDPRAIVNLEILFSNWLIRNSEILSGEILSACAEWPEIRNYFLKHNLISTRELERLRNHINNKNRWSNIVERPIRIYESKRHIYKFSKKGIQSIYITEPRDEELRNLDWGQRQITLLVETRDALAPQVQAIVKSIGDIMVVILTQVLGRSLGLIGRGIAQGMGRSLGKG